MKALVARALAALVDHDRRGQTLAGVVHPVHPALDHAFQTKGRFMGTLSMEAAIGHALMDRPKGGDLLVGHKDHVMDHLDRCTWACTVFQMDQAGHL